MSRLGYLLARPFIRRMEPEKAHDLAIRALEKGWVPKPRRLKFPSSLAVKVWDLDFPNPIGLAAGFDKNAEVPDAMLAQGFGFVEVGSVTPRPQAGNPKPRLFRLDEDDGVINRLGFNNVGLGAVGYRLKQRKLENRPGIVGANLGKNKDSDDAVADYVEGMRLLGPLVDYVVINVSSPNTPGLRDLQEADDLSMLLRVVKKVRGDVGSGSAPRLLVKIAPDLSPGEVEDIAKVVLDVGMDGIIATNTTTQRADFLKSPEVVEQGGLSGRPLFNLSTRVLSHMYKATEGQVPLIGVGGVFSGEDAYRKIRAGASLVQLYSAMVYRGPGIARAVCRELDECLKRDGFSSVAQAVGADHN